MYMVTDVELQQQVDGCAELPCNGVTFIAQGGELVPVYALNGKWLFPEDYTHRNISIVSIEEAIVFARDYFPRIQKGARRVRQIIAARIPIIPKTCPECGSTPIQEIDEETGRLVADCLCKTWRG